MSGDTNLLVVRASTGRNGLTDVDEAAAIVYAVDHCARVITLSFGGPTTSTTERRAIDYAVEHGVLLVAAVGNDFREGDPVQYPAALLQPVRSREYLKGTASGQGRWNRRLGFGVLDAGAAVALALASR